MRVVIADDEMILREGLARLLVDAGVDVVGTAPSAGSLLKLVARLMPDVAIIDIRMPPTFVDEGLQAAEQIREAHPTTAVLVLSHHVESAYAARLLKHHPERSGYLLKERVSDIAVLMDALQRLTEGESILDPTIVSRLLGRPRRAGPLDTLTNREREVLSAMAEGCSNTAIAKRLFLAPKTVEAHIHRVLQKLDISPDMDSHRRVIAVLTYLQSR